MESTTRSQHVLNKERDIDNGEVLPSHIDAHNYTFRATTLSKGAANYEFPFAVTSLHLLELDSDENL